MVHAPKARPDATCARCQPRFDPTYRSGMRAAALFDIHGNVDALEAVLAAAAVAGCDRLLLGGDYAYLGPAPAEVVDVLLAYPGEVIAIRGNTDRMIANGDDAVACWAGERLGDERVAWLRELPEQVAVVEHGALLVHATPRSDEERLLPDTDLGRADAMLAGVVAKTVLCGHVHLQYRRVVGAVEVVNPGSTGLPLDGETTAAWAIVDDGVVSLQRTEYDLERTLARLAAAPLHPAGALVRRRLRTALP